MAVSREVVEEGLGDERGCSQAEHISAVYSLIRVHIVHAHEPGEALSMDIVVAELCGERPHFNGDATNSEGTGVDSSPAPFSNTFASTTVDAVLG